MHYAAIGTLRQFAAEHQFGSNQSEADIALCRTRALRMRRRARLRWRIREELAAGAVVRSGSPLSGANRKTFGSSEPCRFRRLFGSIHSTSLSALGCDGAFAKSWPREQL